MPDPVRLPLERLCRAAASGPIYAEALDLASPIDRGRPFIAEELTPLSYTAVFRELSPAQALRYNQISALAAGELIGLFEEEVALVALRSLRSAPLPADLRVGVGWFLEEEARHAEVWAGLNRLSEPSWYGAEPRRIVRPAEGLLGVMRWIAGRPRQLPGVFWMMLLQEERSIAISRRSLAVAERLEPRWVAVFRLHLRDEIRHVHLDWHLLDRFYRDRSRPVRRLTAELLRRIVATFFLAPKRMAVRVVDLLIREHPELAPLRPRCLRELAALENDPVYRRMMYSREELPISFHLLDSFPELAALRDFLLGPPSASAEAAA
jgi:hypothetical protein